MSKILITGANGQLGTELRHLLDERGIAYDARDAKDMDITDRQAVEEQVTALKPAVIYHCAAYTAVDKAEDEGKKINWRVNEDGTRNLAEVAAKVGAKLVYLSTDYVFDGTNTGEYEVSDPTNP
ncbi:sugar nucleotide-binding protein, partial [Limosilactobacillus mucosae]|nr:sugar nucleotide-binding protein [Limosilactobacillus mucosae]